MENLDYYNKSMSRTLIDKMFFLPHVDATLFVDYGCGDGSLIEACSYFKPESVYCGYDNNPKQIELATNKSYNDSIVCFVDNIEEIKKLKSQLSDKKSCLILSSVIHEVYSYQSEEEIEKFWDFVTNTGFDYIAIRDMYPADYNPESLENDIYKIIKNKEYSDKLKQFKEKWGNLDEGSNFNHFIFKYFQTENWERELNENYLPLDMYDLYHKFYGTNYKILYENDYILPFLKTRVKKDFGITLREPTHYQLLLDKQ